MPPFSQSARFLATQLCCSRFRIHSYLDVQALHKLGVSLDSYAVHRIARYAGIALARVVGALLAWRKADDWLALLVALSLIYLGAFLNLSAVAASTSIWRLPAECFSLMNSLAALFTFALFPTGRPCHAGRAGYR